MGVRYAEFLGKFYLRPAARGTFRAKKRAGVTNADLTSIALIGTSSNGNYFNNTALTMDERIMEFSSFEDAYSILGDGDLSDAVKACFPPSRDTRFTAPQAVRVLCVSDNTAASATAAANYVGVTHTVSAAIPGNKGNALRFKFASSGTVISYGDSKAMTTTQPIDADTMSIQYTGNGTTAVIEVDSVSLKTTITGQSDGSLSLNISFTDYKTIGDLAEYLNAQIGYSATVIASPDSPCERLDHILAAEAVSILTAQTLTSLFYYQKVVLESTEAFKITAGTSNKPFADSVSFVYLAGGAEGTAATQDYLDAIDFLKASKYSGFFVNALTTNTSVGARLADYAMYGNSPEGSSEKFTGWGLDTTLSFSARIDLCKAVNSEYMAVGGVPVKMLRADGVTEKTFPGWMLAVIHNAIKASANMRETPTYKDLAILDAPEVLSDVQIDKALAAGMLVVDRKPNKGAFKITRALTSYQNQNLILNESSICCTALAMVKYLREQLEANFVGEVPVDPSTNDAVFTDADIRTFVDGIIKVDFIQRFGYLSRNIYTGEAAFDFNYTIQRDGDIIYFVFPDGNVVSPINFMFFLLNLDTIRGTSTGGAV